MYNIRFPVAVPLQWWHGVRERARRRRDRAYLLHNIACTMYNMYSCSITLCYTGGVIAGGGERARPVGMPDLKSNERLNNEQYFILCTYIIYYASTRHGEITRTYYKESSLSRVVFIKLKTRI